MAKLTPKQLEIWQDTVKILLHNEIVMDEMWEKCVAEYACAFAEYIQDTAQDTFDAKRSLLHKKWLAAVGATSKQSPAHLMLAKIFLIADRVAMELGERM